MNLQDLFYKYFIQPMITGSGYNVVNTLAYSLIFIIISVFVFKILEKLKIKIDTRLVLAILPFVLLGCLIRVLEDANMLEGFIFMTPGIWFLFLGVIIISLFSSIFIERKFKIPYYKIIFIIGFILVAPLLGIIQYKNFTGFFYVFLWFLPIPVILKFIKWTIENKILTAIHGFDSIVTFVSINYFGYEELHVLPKFIINLTGTPFSFVILKLFVVISVLIFIDKYSKDEELKKFIKLLIGILGFAPGTRDFLRLLWLV